ncbi:efflux RND transporter permease subunit [Oceanidesulfovibrio marinus]|uniref:AcrB/AcrD/AcrF family protein n=1 Tax=Oceanidesulfovibrio marinus TaxID=370038 RepID=A0A6P1ZHS0_9BACT|nr:efflux RND transporter permease subunit [Oceanidesulfovibrio marinus]TVM34172.1 AcrB/AcrD/AcrF family protein [Oceanidesulfovibrio marinus]
MKPVVRFSLKQTVFFNLVFVLLMVVGAFALINMPVERYPLINFGKVVITTYFPGASAEEVEKLVTHEIEDALEDLEDVEFIRSTSYRERSSILVKFVDDSDYDKLFNELRFKILTMVKELPEDIDPPEFVDIKTSDWLPVVAVNLAGNRSNRALTLMAEEMKIPLAQIPGVQEVELRGEYEREFHVYLDPERMMRVGVTFDDVVRSLTEANVSIPSGTYDDGTAQFVVKVDERFRNRQDVVDTIIRRDMDGSFVRLEDVISRAELAYRDPFVITSVNGRDSVSLQVIKTEAGNALDIKEQVLQIVDGFEQRLKDEGVDVVLTQDSTTYIKDAMSTLGWNLLVGVVLVCAIIWYFMGVRNAGLTTIGIPFSFLVTMIFMYFTGNSLNEITLFSFVLVSGIIVDDAIVVVENIYRHVQEGWPLRKAIVNGTAEVFLPVISATTTTVAAFLPMLIMTGTTGEFFAQVPIAISFAILASLIECLLILPIHYLDHGPRKDSHVPDEEKDNIVIAVSRRITAAVTGFTLRRRFLSIGIVIVAFVTSIAVLGVSVAGVAPLIRIKFFPDDYNLYYIIVDAPSSTPVRVVSDKLKDISHFVMDDGPGMAESTSASAGFFINEDYEMVYGENYGYVVVTLPAKNLRDFGDRAGNDPLLHLEEMRRRVKAAYEKDGWKVRLRAEKGGPPTGKDITVRVRGQDPDNVHRLAAAVQQMMRSDERFAPYLSELGTDQAQPARVFQLKVREERAAEYGVSPQRVARLAASVLDGTYVGEYRLSDEDVDLKLRFSQEYLQTPEKALSIPLIEHPSGPVRLGDLVRVETYTDPAYLIRYDGDRAVTISANLVPNAPTSTPAVVKQIRDAYNAMKGDYPGAQLTFGGDFESTQRSYTSLAYAFIIAVLLIYLILATQFRSYLQPAIILSAVVFSLIGVVVGKLATQSYFTVNSFIALVGVTGVVVNDSLVLVNFMNVLREQGASRAEAIREGIRVRLRPILLTTLTTTLGLLPMAVGFPQYSLVWGSMASTFVTGLCTATALTLFIVPVEWDLLEGLKERVRRRKARRSGYGLDEHHADWRGADGRDADTRDTES